MSESIYLEIEWISRHGYLSRILDYDDMGIPFAVLDMIQDRFGAL